MKINEQLVIYNSKIFRKFSKQEKQFHFPMFGSGNKKEYTSKQLNDINNIADDDVNILAR